MEHQELIEKLNRVNLKVKSGLNYSASEMIDDLIQSIQPNGGDRMDYKLEIKVNKKTIDSNEEAIRQMQNDIYKVAQIYFECVGEHEGFLIGNGHHMAQELCEKAKEIWVSRQNAR